MDESDGFPPYPVERLDREPVRSVRLVKWTCGKNRSEQSHRLHAYLVDGFNPSEKYQSNWIISPSRGEKMFETTT